MPELPSGTVTFLFSDIEGSTRLLNELGSERYSEELAKPSLWGVGYIRLEEAAFSNAWEQGSTVTPENALRLATAEMEAADNDLRR